MHVSKRLLYGVSAGSCLWKAKVNHHLIYQFIHRVRGSLVVSATHRYDVASTLATYKNLVFIYYKRKLLSITRSIFFNNTADGGAAILNTPVTGELLLHRSCFYIRI